MDRLSPIDVLDATHHIGQLQFSGTGAHLVSRGRPVGSVPEPDSQLNLWRLKGSRYERLQLPTGRLYVRDVALDHAGKQIALTGFDGEEAYRGTEWGETPYRLRRVIQLWDGDSRKKTFERPADETHLVRFDRASIWKWFRPRR
jgi:hypothetical protein